MKEKELRIALVCYGGVSLAVYMHGVTKEILKLVRASRIYHYDVARSQRRSAKYHDIDHDDRETDTEALYFELIQAIGQSLELRVFVDTIAGASVRRHQRRAACPAHWRTTCPWIRTARCGSSKPTSWR